MTMMMDNSGIAGGYCVTRYGTEKMDRIMLRYRPIAPKPTTAGASSHGGSTLENTSRGGGSRKRRYVQKNSSSKKRSKTASPEVVTLTLLPDTSLKRPTSNSPIWLNFNSGTAEKDDRRPIYCAPDPTAVIIPPRVTTGTCITLECLTYTMVDVDALGQTDKERVMNLERDTCPGFVSDRLSQVTWSNAAFSKMVNDDRGSGRCCSRAWVVMKESVPISARAFSCRVKVEVDVEADTNKVISKRRMTVPCDVWRMDCGGFAWRLDVKSALSLG